MKLSNKAYDILKWASMIVLPAAGTLYTALAAIWGLPYGEQVGQTVLAVETFLGAVLMVSNAQYKKEVE